MVALLKLHEVKIKLDHGSFYSRTVEKLLKVKYRIFKAFTEPQYSDIIDLYEELQLDFDKKCKLFFCYQLGLCDITNGSKLN